METARRLELAHDGFERVLPFGEHFDLDPAQLHWALALPDHHHGVVEGELGCVNAAHSKNEGAPAGTDLEDLADAAPTRNGVDPATDGSFGAQTGKAIVGEVLGDFEALAQAAGPGRGRVLERDLVVASPRPGAKHESGAHHPPVLGIEI